jgi:Excreted virulence factor EspC, type VII ESX diderm
MADKVTVDVHALMRAATMLDEAIEGLEKAKSRAVEASLPAIVWGESDQSGIAIQPWNEAVVARGDDIDHIATDLKDLQEALRDAAASYEETDAQNEDELDRTDDRPDRPQPDRPQPDSPQPGPGQEDPDPGEPGGDDDPGAPDEPDGGDEGGDGDAPPDPGPASGDDDD